MLYHCFFFMLLIVVWFFCWKKKIWNKKTNAKLKAICSSSSSSSSNINESSSNYSASSSANPVMQPSILQLQPHLLETQQLQSNRAYDEKALQVITKLSGVTFKNNSKVIVFPRWNFKYIYVFCLYMCVWSTLQLLKIQKQYRWTKMLLFSFYFLLLFNSRLLYSLLILFYLKSGAGFLVELLFLQNCYKYIDYRTSLCIFLKQIA